MTPTSLGLGELYPQPAHLRNRDPLTAAASAAAPTWSPGPGRTIAPRDWLAHARAVVAGLPGLPHVQAVVERLSGAAPCDDPAALSQGVRPDPAALPEGYRVAYLATARRVRRAVLGRLREADAQREAGRLLAELEAMRWLPLLPHEAEGVRGRGVTDKGDQVGADMDLVGVAFADADGFASLVARCCDVAEWRAGVACGMTDAAALEAQPVEALDAETTATAAPSSEAVASIPRAGADRGSRSLDRFSLDRKGERENRDLEFNSRAQVATAPPAARAPHAAAVAERGEQAEKPEADRERARGWTGVTMDAIASKARALEGPLPAGIVASLPEAVRPFASRWLALHEAAELLRGDVGENFAEGPAVRALGADAKTVRALRAWASRSGLVVRAADPWGRQGYALDRQRLANVRRGALRTGT